MADLGTLLSNLRVNRSLEFVARNPRAQFGTRQRRYLGATLLPERLVPENAFTEEQIRYRSVIANANTRYSPTQKKGGALVGSFDVKLAESDIAAELTSREYDTLLKIIGRGASMQAVAQVIGFVETQVNVPLVEWVERARWQAIVNALVLLRGDNEYTEDVAYSNPSGHRAAAGGAWSNDSYDPMTDIFAMADLLASKGYPLVRVIGSRNVVGILGGNDNIKTRTSRITVAPGGTISAVTGRATAAEINGILNADGIPAIEQYDLLYQTNTGTGRFLPNNVLVFIGATAEQTQIDLGDSLLPLDNVLGYAAIGRAAGQAAAGRVIRSEAFDNKPPRIEAEGWQTALPVVTQPEAIAVITGIS